MQFYESDAGESYYRCDTPAFVLHILEQFSAEDTIAFFRELGVMTRDRQGYCYPRSGQASAIRNALLRKAEKLGIEIHNGIGIRKIIRENNRFSFDTKVGAFFDLLYSGYRRYGIAEIGK